VNQAHKQVAYLRPVQSPIEQRVFPVQNHAFQCPLDDVMPTSGLCRVHWILEVPQGFKMVADAA
jgi:hypothetical protein